MSLPTREDDLLAGMIGRFCRERGDVCGSASRRGSRQNRRGCGAAASDERGTCSARILDRRSPAGSTRSATPLRLATRK